MALVLKDRVQETTTTTGTGTITLAGAVTGFQSFSVVGNGNTCYYAIVGTNDWEVGLGTYTSSGTTLARNTVLESSNSGSLVDFPAGSKYVFLTYPAERAVTTTDPQTLESKTFQSYAEKVETVGSIGTSTYNMDLSLANIFDITLGTDVTITFTNPVSSGYSKPVTIIVRQPSSSPGKTLTVTNALYTDGTAPILSTGANDIDVLTYWSIDGGTTYFGTFAMANVS